jgi:peptidoglycan L-alanyl-D-glutamate endopeptidase CwlK
MGEIVGLSLARLNTCHPLIREIVHEANNIMEMSVLCGVRLKEEQDKAYADKKSTLKWPYSKHNLKDKYQKFSHAVDIIPYFLEGKSHYDWRDSLAFSRLAGVMFAVAHSKGIKIRWGGDWDLDNRSADEHFLDLPHFELLLDD